MEEKNYYIAVKFRERPNTHLTLGYFKELNPTELQELVEKVGRVMTSNLPRWEFEVSFTEEGWFGPKNTVRVLRSEYRGWPVYFLDLINIRVAGRSASTKYEWTPHVTTDEDRLDLTAVSICVMYKKRTIVEWGLSKRQ